MKKNNVILAHRYCMNNKHMLDKDKLCGCFYCMKIFVPMAITDWIDEENGLTALCPFCGVDSVIGESSGYPITTEFLKDMNTYWF